MELGKIVCTNCGSSAVKEREGKTARCEACGNTYVIEIAKKLSEADAEKIARIGNLRQRLNAAVESNDIKNISSAASRILEIIPEDYFALYLFAYAENAMGRHGYLSDFYDKEPSPHTEEELLAILSHIAAYSDLRDRVKIEGYLMSLDDIDTMKALSAYKTAFRQRKALEENYDDIPRDVFICHRSSDNKKAQEVLRALEQDSHRCWISTRNLRPNDSENYWDNIRRAITSCKIFLVVSSEDAMLSNDVKNELRIASELNKPRVEYKIDSVPHTTLFKTFFDGRKWIEDGGDGISLMRLCTRIHGELERLARTEKRPDRIEELAELLKTQTSVVRGESGAEITGLLKKARLQMEDGDFTGAEQTCERMSDIDVENADLWLYRLLIALEMKSLHVLSAEALDFNNRTNEQNAAYEKFLRYASLSQKTEVDTAIEAAQNRFDYEKRIAEEKRKEEEKRLEEKRKEEERKRKEEAKKLEEKRKAEKKIQEERKKKRNKQVLILVSVFCIAAIALGLGLGLGLRNVLPYTYTEVEGGYAVGVDSSYRGIEGKFRIPKEHKGKPVVAILENGFQNCTRITSIAIPDSVTSIGEYAFSDCTSLTQISIPESVKSIEKYTFAGCTRLTQISILGSVTSIGEYAFSRCTSLTQISIPDSVTSIGEHAFSNCTSLTQIILPDSVKSIGEYAFSNCTRLTQISIPDSVTSIGAGAFSNCTSLTQISIPDSVKGIRDYTFSHCTSLTQINLPDSVTSIGKRVFLGCTSLTQISLPDSVKIIGEFAFANCTGLIQITLPDRVTSVGACTFSNCTSLTQISIPDSVTSIGAGAFSHCSSLTQISIPDSVKSIGASAFSDCSSLTQISIPDSVTSIGEYAFAHCTSLPQISIPDSVASIGACTFYNCSSLTQITLSDGVTSIGSHAFYNCISLTQITLTDGVKNIGEYAFFNCTSLTQISILGSVTRIGEHAFSDCISLTTVYYGGTEENWARITIEGNNIAIKNATCYYYSEVSPVDAGMYWRWVDGLPVAW